MHILRHLVSGCILAAAAAAFLTQGNPEHDRVQAATQEWQCADMAYISWHEMDSRQRILADACDRSEADQNWVVAYGAMNSQTLAAAVVHEPH